MKLIVGLGNPGMEYARTRHNMGFMVIDALAKKWQSGNFKLNFQGEYVLQPNHQTILFKPTTFMNASGTAVQLIMQFYKIPIQDLVVIYDDLSLEPGKIRLRLSGSSGSHNGIQHIIDVLGTQDIKRVRVGIGAVPTQDKGKDYVLGIPSATDQVSINKAITDATLAIEDYLLHDFSHAMNRFNRGSQD
jgi:peptidyl-tRNA hydrolase, PTH1 family